MREFSIGIWNDVKEFVWWQTMAIILLVVVIYGMLLFNLVTAYDFNAAKGDFLQVFLTYFFMHRSMSGFVAAAFHDFSPFWTLSVGLFFLVVSGHLLAILFKRIGFCRMHSLIGVALWLSAPFFFNQSIYQHAFPSASIAFCCDMLAMLAFLEVRRNQGFNWRLMLAAVVMVAIATSFYQAHIGLVLTAFLGILVLDSSKDLKALFKDWWLIVLILCGSVLLWLLINHGPMIIAKIVGIPIPKSGGAHDTIFWLDGTKSFCMNLKSLFVGFILNWGYNAFFVIGLRWVLISLVFCFCLVAVYCVHRKWSLALSLLVFALSVFAMPVIQCSFANLRPLFCLIALISFSGMMLMRLSRKIPILSGVVLLVAFLGMAHETSTLYYYNWKVKEHDKLHMSIVARDLWTKYGLKIDKPVAIIGGWKHYPTCWEDLRPFRQLPLINHPFTTYSNMTCANVPREFYMVAREKIGLLVPMPDLQTYVNLKADKRLLEAPAYPMPGYIFEHDGVIVVNLGKAGSQWGTFRYGDYASPNEKLLDRTIGLRRFDQFLLGATSWFRKLAEDYPWTLTTEPEGIKK